MCSLFGLLAHRQELGHHVVIFVGDVMAVHHVLVREIREFQYHPRRNVGAKPHPVLPARLTCFPWAPLDAQDQEPDQVRVDRVGPAAPGVHKAPDLGRAKTRTGIEAIWVELLVVDRPEAIDGRTPSSLSSPPGPLWARLSGPSGRSVAGIGAP